MKYILLTLSSILLMSCTTAKTELSEKSFRHVYLYYTAMNEFGKGGGNQQLVLSFTNSKVTLYNIHERSEATENGGQKTERDTVDKYTASYSISNGIVTIDSPVVPEAMIVGDTLIVPKINITIDGENSSELFNDAVFKKKDQ